MCISVRGSLSAAGARPSDSPAAHACVRACVCTCACDRASQRMSRHPSPVSLNPSHIPTCRHVRALAAANTTTPILASFFLHLSKFVLTKCGDWISPIFSGGYCIWDVMERVSK